ncbi:hypothetical protein BDW42DRAFT_191967 [Aspergillus taichungensis]|uniref:Uncharacterized protein n=1 Tax=Aspergillus taichungensis TaxID=482145 RepID=A0A2J5I2Q1_9EURO|nr:hypothetical protein BDW42DRAFT_191967 [Aspergillus taichungensis]
MAPQEVFLPACPKPMVIEPHERIEQLRGCLDDPKYARQKTNILALIKMYETGQLGALTMGYTVYICDGKVWEGKLSSENLPPRGSIVWAEPAASQMARSGSFGFLAGNSMHEIFARVRLIADFGGSSHLYVSVRIANDTGSNVQSIFDTDLTRLQYDPHTYLGTHGQVPLTTASGIIFREQIVIELQIVDSQGEEISPWFAEVAVIIPEELGVVRLSGGAMRNQLYFATAPGNDTLYISRKKNGVVSQLPVV